MTQMGVIILSLGGNEELRNMTQTTIDTCLSKDTSVDFKVVVCESMENVRYKNAITIHPTPNIPFNYNAYMNMCRGVKELGESK